jgi:membrane-bound inhibitor of C-type lysozyme
MLRRAVPAAALIAPLFFGACGERAAEPETEATAPAATDPDPLAPDAPLPAPAMIEASYDCTPAMALSVKYDNTVDPPKAVATLDGKTYDLTLSPSASGARYMTLEGRKPGMTLVWWNKGRDGFLQEGKGATSDDEKNIATCVEKSS